MNRDSAARDPSRDKSKGAPTPGSATAGAVPDGAPLPPRRLKHRSERIRLIRWFYWTLIAIFVALTIGLIWWGVESSGMADRGGEAGQEEAAAAGSAASSSVRIALGSRKV